MSSGVVYVGKDVGVRPRLAASGTKRKLTDEQAAVLIEAIKRPVAEVAPGELRWSVKAVQSFILAKFGKEIGLKGAWLYMKRSGAGFADGSSIRLPMVCMKCSKGEDATTFRSPRSQFCVPCIVGNKKRRKAVPATQVGQAA